MAWAAGPGQCQTPDARGHEARSLRTDGGADRVAAAVRPEVARQARADDRKVLGGTIFNHRNGLRWLDAPAACRPAKTLCNRRLCRRGMGPRAGPAQPTGAGP